MCERVLLPLEGEGDSVPLLVSGNVEALETNLHIRERREGGREGGRERREGRSEVTDMYIVQPHSHAWPHPPCYPDTAGSLPSCLTRAHGREASWDR